MDYIHHCGSPLGGITLAACEDGLTGLWFDGQKYFGSTLGTERVERDIPVFDAAEHWLRQYFQGLQPETLPPLAPRGTPFRQAVWQLLLQIPYGQTVTYGELAARLAKEMNRSQMSAQAVGGAVGHNPISLMIPCHRVIGADGSLTGYAGGVERKLKLLRMEGADPSGFSL